MRVTTRRLPLRRLTRCFSSAVLGTPPQPRPKLKFKPKFKPPTSAEVDPSKRLVRTLRNDGSFDTTVFDTTLRHTMTGQAQFSPPVSGLPRPKKKPQDVDPAEQLARALRNKGSIDATLRRTMIAQGPRPRPRQADADPAEQLARALRNNGSIDTTLRRTTTTTGNDPFSPPVSVPRPKKKPHQAPDVDPAEQLARALRNKGSIDATLRRTTTGNGNSTFSPVSVPRPKKKAHQAPDVDPAEQLARALRNKGNLDTKFISSLIQQMDQMDRSTPKDGATLATSPTGWGADALRPTSQYINAETPTEIPTSKTRLDRSGIAPHLQPEPTLSYSRRIEGLLEPTDTPTLETVDPPSEQYPIATLSHGLDRVLFNPGVHWLQDPRSKVYNFPPYLEVIPKVTDFAFERLGSFIKSSHDNDLWDLARREKRTFAGSTSSLSGMLSHVYFLLSGDKHVNTDGLSRHFGKEPRDFTSGQRMPASVVLNHNDGVYAIDSDGDKNRFAEKNILTWMGTLLEKFLTSSPEEFAPYMRFNPPPPPVEKRLRDAYRFAKSKSFVMRSQLDCVDPRLPGTGVFDIKTRACLPIRMDLLNFEENSGYLLRSLTGKIESFEREYYDLIRSAFLKYSFQVRIGNMDGVIVAYHNTAQIFGFQYISLQEMDEAIFGSGKGVGDRVFGKCVGLLEKVLEEAVACYPGESVKCTFEKLDTDNVMNVWVQPARPEVAEGEAVPITQLEVSVSNFLGQSPVRGSAAVASIDEPWTTQWSISRLMSSGDDARLALDAAKARQFRYIDIPTGLDVNTVGAMWSALNFGGVQREGAGHVPPIHYFKEAGPRTQELRDLARAGRADTAKKVMEEEGQAKVWVNGRVEWTELQKVLEMYRNSE
ncbi:hypothetical protein C0992_003933 [Termitomyces sp. T32_za158]|nr:hypothetical protein C0992_003933 [Termitomyces sp. T32_za158]